MRASTSSASDEVLENLDFPNMEDFVEDENFEQRLEQVTRRSFPRLEEFRFHHIFKVVFVGPAGVGKTRLLEEYMGAKHRPFPTIGVDIVRQILPESLLTHAQSLKYEPLRETMTCLQLWDTPGSRTHNILEWSHLFYKSHAVVLVWDGKRSTWNTIRDYWIPLAQDHTKPHSPFFVFIATGPMNPRTRFRVDAKCAELKSRLFCVDFEQGQGVKEAMRYILRTLLKRYVIDVSNDSQPPPSRPSPDTPDSSSHPTLSCTAM